jgi:hypothetical protein
VSGVHGGNHPSAWWRPVPRMRAQDAAPVRSAGTRVRDRRPGVQVLRRAMDRRDTGCGEAITSGRARASVSKRSPLGRRERIRRAGEVAQVDVHPQGEP